MQKLKNRARFKDKALTNAKKSAIMFLLKIRI